MTNNWLDGVVNHSGVSVQEAEAMLRRRGIAPDRPLRPARTLTVNRVMFRGEKRGSETGRFEFDWADLTHGVWALASHDNLAGKSTVLEILLWCLRGEPKGLQDDIRSWLEFVSVHFSVDDQRYKVEFMLEQRIPVGSLSRIRPDGSVDVIDEFFSESGFAATMSHFMMETLDLDPVPARQNAGENGRTVIHGWTALSGALYFGGDHKLLLGDVQWGGLPARMLQMYVGLPWARTVMQASTAQKEVEQEVAKIARETREAEERVEAGRMRLQEELKDARQHLAATSDDSVTVEDIERLAAEVAKLSTALIEMQRRVAQAEDEYTLLQRAADDDERTLRDMRENVVATSFFNGLQPTCCPRCDAAVPRARVQQESQVLSCSLCSESITSDRIEDESQAIADAEQRRDASQAAVARAKAALAPLRGERDRVQAAMKADTAALSTIPAGDAFRKRRNAELAIARIEGALKEHSTEPLRVAPPTDSAVVSAAFREAKASFEHARGDLLNRLNEEILRLGNAFGVHRLEQVNLNSNAQMRLRKGGESTSFSKLTPGERLRLRIVTAIALLRVGRERGVGRHPGLLIIDSPGAEETSENDLATLLNELVTVAAESGGLQILIASANVPAVAAALDAERFRVALPGQRLW